MPTMTTPTPANPSQRETQRGRLVIISGPSGAGKSTVVRQLLEECDIPLTLSGSATTRAPRPGETSGVHYYFLSPEEFRERRLAGEFLECKEVFGRGDWYGTLQTQVAAGLEAGKWVILEIDVEGTLSVLEKFPDTLTIFIHSGSIEELERRLRLRNTESEESLQRRLEVARRELTFISRYKYQVINRDVAQAVREVCEILKSQGER